MTPTTAGAQGSPLFEDGTPYHLLFEHSMDGIMFTAPDGSILDANPAACRMFERTREEIIAAGRQGLVDSSDPRVAELLAERERTGKAHGELSARRRDGTPFPVEVSSVVFKDSEGHSRTCMILRDASQSKAAEAERERLIHELQESLAQVKTLSGLLPMCAACRRIRDQQNVWHDLESYVRTHTETQFSHGICPDCRRRLYPETIRG